MKYEAFENLEMLPSILEDLRDINSRLKKLEESLIPKLDLTKRADVRKYLGICNATLDNMMNDGRLRQGVHFIRETKGKQNKIIFISQSIIDFKKGK